MIRRDASALEWLAAHEVARYAYLRTGKVLPVDRAVPRAGRIHVTIRDRVYCGALGQDLRTQQFLIKTDNASGARTWWIVGGDDIGTLYGAYRFAEKLGVQFGLEGDALPDDRLAGAWPEINERGRPRFALRGLQPFHDFSVGPDWWNEQDYRNVLSQMAKLKLNFIGLHTYPSWNPATGPEANVWIGLPEDVDARGDVRFGYQAGVATTRRGWAVTPFPTRQYASGAGLLFEEDDYGPDFMRDCLDWPRNETAARAMFNRYGDFQKKVFQHAHRLGVKTCVGTELPLGIPKELAAHLGSKGLDPGDPAVIRRLYEGTFLRLMRKMPIDYYWLWTPEVWLSMEPGCANWEMTSREQIEKDLVIAAAATESLHLPFGFATCGWRLGTREDALWIHKRVPTTWAASSINTQLGRDSVERAYRSMAGRPRWVIGWAEDDDTAGAHCCTAWDLQLWVKRMLANSGEASAYGCEGMMAIHWRTAAISPNIAALARAGWDYGPLASDNPPAASSAGNVPGADAFWAEWGRGAFGGETGAAIGRTLQDFDGGHIGINELIRGGASTTDEQITKFFAPLRQLESFRTRVRGAGNLARLDYWVNLVRATELRVRTWVLAERLTAKMREANGIPESSRRRDFVSQVALPLRLSLSRHYEDMIAAFVDCARSPGELGTISSMESGSRGRVVTAHDKVIEEILGQPLPPAAALRSGYRAAPRIFVSSQCSLALAHEPLEIRAFVLSDRKCGGLNLFWRPLGRNTFSKTPARHRSRQAYSAVLPTATPGTVEYYFEASFKDRADVQWPAGAPALCETTVIW